MAFILRNGEIFVNPNDGQESSTVYMVIDDLTIRKRQRYAIFEAAIYAKAQARSENRQPIFAQTVRVDGADFMTYFNPANNAKVYQQCYDYLAARGLPGLDMSRWKKDTVDES